MITSAKNIGSIKKTTIMKHKFKDGQKVMHPKYGEGVISINTFEDGYCVDFGEINRHWSQRNDDFYNQLEPIEDLPEVGEYAYFWYDGEKHCIYAKLEKINKESHMRYKPIGCLYHQNISKTPPFV